MFLEVGLDLSHVLVTIGLIACVLFFWHLLAFDELWAFPVLAPLANFLI
jgi:hypothetical protein